MSRNILFVLTVILFAFFTECVQSQNLADPNNEFEEVPTIALIKLDVNDTNLELSWKIKNNTDHNIWICDNVDVFTTFDYEAYLAEDEQSLLIRRRLDVPTAWQWTFSPDGRYVLLRSGGERTETMSIDLPVEPQRVFASKLATSDQAKRLVIEIGYYNEDLPKTIRDTIEIAEKLNCASIKPSEHEAAILMRYFKGLWIGRTLFGGVSDFEKYTYQAGNKEIEIPYTHQQFGGEQILRIEVDGVHIPYEEAERPTSRGRSINPKGRACFLPETLVWVDGKILPISKLVVGQSVGRPLYTTQGLQSDWVEKVQEHIGTFECRDILLESENNISVVGNHYFMLDSGRWIAAQDLKRGMRLQSKNGTISIKSITKRATPYTGKVYNLKIKNSDMYMVGEDAVIVRDY